MHNTLQYRSIEVYYRSDQAVVKNIYGIFFLSLTMFSCFNFKNCFWNILYIDRRNAVYVHPASHKNRKLQVVSQKISPYTALSENKMYHIIYIYCTVNALTINSLVIKAPNWWICSVKPIWSACACDLHGVCTDQPTSLVCICLWNL